MASRSQSGTRHNDTKIPSWLIDHRTLTTLYQLIFVMFVIAALGSTLVVASGFYLSPEHTAGGTVTGQVQDMLMIVVAVTIGFGVILVCSVPSRDFLERERASHSLGFQGSSAGSAGNASLPTLKPAAVKYTQSKGSGKQVTMKRKRKPVKAASTRQDSSPIYKGSAAHLCVVPGVGLPVGGLGYTRYQRGRIDAYFAQREFQREETRLYEADFRPAA